MLMIPDYIKDLTGLWLELRRNPVKFANNRYTLENFFRKASFDEENAFYIHLHGVYENE